ncbi:MAG: FAD-dependent oxidoreductase, partial [Burkholderiales bacterium]|nr:FAD-dependent oxidoreductase [Burkholderiales bacterium]
MRLDKRWWVVVVLGGLLALFFGLDLGRFLSLAAIKSSQAQLLAWREGQPLLAGLIFFGGYVAVTALSLPGAAAMTLAAGALFGLGWGTLIVSFASSIGATLAFLAARWLLGGWVQARFGDRLAPLNTGIAKEGGYYLFTLRLVPVLPFFVINLAMGMTTLRAWSFYWVSQIGMLAGTLVYVNAGTQLARIDSLSGIVSPGVLGSLVLLGVFPLMTRKAIDLFQARKVYAKFDKPARFERNLVVIGGGSAGLVTAYIAAAIKARVTLVEKHALGGDCLNTGCVPSKALIRSARFLSHVQRAREFGMRSAQADFDFGAVMERVQRVIDAVAPHDSVERYTGLGVDVAQGTARIVSPWAVEITYPDGRVQTLTTRAIVIAAGARPFVPPIPGLSELGPTELLTSDNVWQLRQRPERLVVLGGGPIGSELTQAFARLGSRVTQVEMLPRILMREDPDVSELVMARFRGEGVTVLTGHKALRVQRTGADKVLVVEASGDERRELQIPFDALLVAVGRTANLKGYGLQELGVTTGRTVEVNGYLQTNFPNIYAAGDVAGPYQFTHTAGHQAWYAAVNALFDPIKK